MIKHIFASPSLQGAGPPSTDVTANTLNFSSEYSPGFIVTSSVLIIAFLARQICCDGCDICTNTAPLRKTNKNCAISVFIFATRRQKGDTAATEDHRMLLKVTMHKETRSKEQNTDVW